MRGICLVFAVAVFTGCSAQQPVPSTTTAIQSVPVSATIGGNAAIAPSKPEEAVSRRSIRVLPADVPADPPEDEDLKAAKRAWRGEYEADDAGKPLLGADGRAVPVLYDRKGKRVKSVVKVPKTHSIAIVEGTLTVDGWTGKARLNHDIPDLRYIYLSAPGIGTVIVSQTAFRGAVEQKGAFAGSTLTVTSDGHQLQLASQAPMLGKRTSSAWVKVDPTYTVDPRYPVMGYGSGLTAPYEWPGAKMPVAEGAKGAPPLPSSMLPKLAPCPAKDGCSVSHADTDHGAAAK